MICYGSYSGKKKNIVLGNSQPKTVSNLPVNNRFNAGELMTTIIGNKIH